jgi:putative Mg2+ transporter-C (MgtC) family protein
MQTLLDELSLGAPDTTAAVRIILRLLVAMLLGAVVGYEREQTRKAAGLRTHVLVSLGSALFVLAPLQAGMPTADVSRIVQGVAAGIGFIGAGAILKLTSEREIRGLTTAASIWMTAAAGIAAGLGEFTLAALATGFAWITLAWLERFERKGPGHNQ